MRVAMLVLLVACSNPASQGAGSASSVVSTTMPGAAPAPQPVPLDPQTLTFVDLPALTPPPGARLMIGLDVVDEVGALSPAGDVLAIAGGKRGVQLIHIPTGRGLALRADLTCAEPDPIYVGPCQPMLAFAADGKRVAVWWPLHSKLVVLAVPSAKTEFEAKVDAVSSLAFLDDGRLVVLGSDTSYAYDAAGTRKELVKAKGYATRISGDGRQVVVEQGKPRILDVATGKVVVEPPGGVSIGDVAFGPDGQSWVASTSDEWEDVFAWRAGDRAVRVLATSREARAKAGGEGVSGFAFPPPFDQVFVGMSSALVGIGLDGQVRFRSAWLTSMQLKHGGIVRLADHMVVLEHLCPVRLDARGQPLTGPLLCALRPSQLGFDGDQLVATPWDGHGIMTLDARTGALVGSRPRGAPYPATGSTLAAIARDPELSGRVERALALPAIKDASFQLSRDGKRLFVGNNGRQSAIIELSTQRARTGMNPFLASRDGARIAIQRLDREDVVDVRSVDGDRLIHTVPVPTTLIDRMMLSDDGRLLVAEGERTTIVLDVATGRTVFDAPCHTPFALSADARVLVCDSIAGVAVYDVRQKKLVRRVEHPNSEGADAVALSDDGRRLAIAADNIVIVDL